MTAGHWFTLVRFKDDPRYLMGVSQARTAQEALDQLTAWTMAHPADTTIVFDPQNRSLERSTLEEQASGLSPLVPYSGTAR
ncbi:MAG TPA: hypothetical protein VH916_04270 [Dehalococcoidia bacterium]